MGIANFEYGQIDVDSLIERLKRQFRNADGPVWFSSILVKNPASASVGHAWDGGKTEAGLTAPAVYEVDWKVVRV